MDGDNRFLRDRSSHLVTPAFTGHVNIRVTHVVRHKLRPAFAKRMAGMLVAEASKVPFIAYRLIGRNQLLACSY